MTDLQLDQQMRLWRVAVDAPLDVLTYEGPTDLCRGMRVFVPLGRGNRKTSGVIIEADPAVTKPEGMNLKRILETDSEFPQLPENYMRWMTWLSQYYVFSLGSVLELAYPPLRQTARTRGSQKLAAVPEIDLKSKHPLTEQQLEVLSRIRQIHQRDFHADLAGFATHLLHGVTGSGKTEVYLELLEETLATGGTGLVLVPEISLTPQLLRRFSERFGNQIATIHSHLTTREKTEQWWRMMRGETKILLGARSALFCPIPNLRLIIVDEEHEPSFKQDDKLKYHARDAAIMLARELQCPIVLGSATPSLESYRNAIEGRYHLHVMQSRVADRPLPLVQVIDLRSTKPGGLHDGVQLPHWMSEDLYKGIRATMEDGDQVAIFLNRRGMATSVLCRACGQSQICPDCDINLTLHGKTHLVCHYCNYSEQMTESCAKCGGEMAGIGIGTEQVEADLRQMFHDKEVARADRDEIQSREALESLVRRMETGEIDILVGTQMIAKGLDFPKLRFAGMVLADVGFNLPDFRATERSFQLLTQMVGRAGRHVTNSLRPSVVVIQTYNPDHPSLRFARESNYADFATFELQNRSELTYPPYCRLGVVRVQGPHRDRVWRSTNLIRSWIEAAAKDKATGLEILGPADAPLARLRRQYRVHLLIKSQRPQILQWLSREILSRQKHLEKGIKLAIDIDPLHLL